MDQKVVYLFGAGATHAELPDNKLEISGLLIRDVSKRVILKAKRLKLFEKVKMFFKAKDDTNIELLISLFENNSSDIQNCEKIVTKLKELVKVDITTILKPNLVDQFILHKSLFELHDIIKDRETLHGIISLNYDTVLDDAYKHHYKYGPDYSFLSSRGINSKGKGEREEKIPLLKLHGSFGWYDLEIFGKKKSVPIMPLGLNKNFLRWPYNFIWGRGLELLTECTLLRIIGCSLSSNDMHLIDLIFKAHLLREKPLIIEIINKNKVGEEIKKRNSFFADIITIDEIVVPPRISVKEHDNIFKEWLKSYGIFVNERKVKKTENLKKIVF